MATQKGMNIILEIAKCNEINIGENNKYHCCNNILNCQRDQQGNKIFQLPEPFNGDIENADILFIGANPNYDPKEPYPTISWLDQDIIDFFLNRKINIQTRYCREILEITNIIRGKKLNQTAVKKISGILDSDKNSSALWMDLKISLTEIVHCKSHSVTDVHNDCERLCVFKYLKKIIELFNGEYIVLIGAMAKNYHCIIQKLKPKSRIIFADYTRFKKIDDVLDDVRKQL